MLVRPISLLIPSESGLVDIDQHVSAAKTSFDQMRSNDQYITLQDHILIYRIIDSQRSYTGIILGVNTAEFTDDKIIHHELTIPSKVARQTAIAKEQSGFSKPILLTNRPIPVINSIIERRTLQKPFVDIHLDRYDAQHQIWQITDLIDIHTIIEVFATRDKAYIVDGHHRTRALQQSSVDPSVKLTYGLCGMFDIEQLEILPFHRIVDINMDPSTFLEHLSTIGNLDLLKSSRFPSLPNEIVVLLNGQAYSFTWPQKDINDVEQLHVNLLSKTILKNILGIDNENTSSRVKYFEGNHSLDTMESEIKGKNSAAFLLQPIAKDSFIDTLNCGHILPPKSTFFLPRMANGIVSMTWK